MSFKGFPWDFANKYPAVLDPEHKGLVSFFFFDAYVERIFIKKISPSLFEDGKKVLLPEDVTVDWIKENIETQDFFSSHTSYYVLQAEQLSSSVKNYITSGEIDWGDRFFILLYGKEDKSFTALSKAKFCHSVKVEAPRFWEGQKLIQFLCDQMGVRLSYQVQASLVDIVPFSVPEYIHALKQVAYRTREVSNINRDDLKSLIGEHKVDQFELARLFGEKKFRSFFDKLLSLDLSFDALMGLFMFLQGHLLKVADPSYMETKARPSKYDKNILVQAKLWDSKAIRDELSFFAECEILAKSKSDQLINKLRIRLIQSY